MKKSIYLVLCLFPLKVLALNVTFILPDYSHHQFWYLLADATQSAAKNSEISLKIIYTDNNRFAFKTAIQQAINSPTKPDYVVFRPFQGSISEVFQELEQQKINFITLEQVLTGEEAKMIGKPRENYQHWLGEVFYDQVAGSELLTKTLIDEHHRRFPGKTAYITGLSGSFDAVTHERNSGLIEQQKKHPNTTLNQIITLNFDHRLVEQRIETIVKRYPNTLIYWCASAQMAVAASSRIEKLTGNDKLIIGGFDWLPKGLNKIKEGKITALVGGHFLMGAKAVNLIIDYHHGIDRFIEQPNIPKEHNHFELITKHNVEQYLAFINNRNWRDIDYSQFLYSNKKLSRQEPITVKNLINAYQKQKNTQ
ncbi:MAG: ABC transporter substrate-binding protein [Thalassotalea sp.]